jgi:UDP-galactopyranose mutase
VSAVNYSRTQDNTREFAEAEKDVWSVGRPAIYWYYNMDHRSLGAHWRFSAALPVTQNHVLGMAAAAAG